VVVGRGMRGLVAVAVLALTAGCGSADTPGTKPAPAAEAAVTPASAAPSVVRGPDAGSTAVPAAPQDKPAVTITGRITGTNVSGALRLDEAALSRLGLLAMSVNDPWAKKRLDLQGVFLRDVIALARPDPAATTLHITALDDYQVDLKLADIGDNPILLATRDGEGALLPVEDGGPTRVVFADDLVRRFSPDLWIWNIDTIEVR
jgi:hypothetical protein